MRAEHSKLQIDGCQLHRMVLHPNADVPVRAACIFTHGQGDYGQRYMDVLHPFTERGIRCIITDLPGHGRSAGTRGHIESQEFIDQVIASNLRETGNLLAGIAGHSMGGLLTLRHLALSLQGLLPTPEFCWVSSPLLKPANGRPDWFVRVAQLVASLIPHLTIDIKASPDLCRRNSDSAELPLSEDCLLGHQRVSLGWGKELLEIAKFTEAVLLRNRFHGPFLMTQGGADMICPPQFAEQLFHSLDWPRKHWQFFPQMLHETFAEPDRFELFDRIAAWLDEEYPSPAAETR